MPEAARCPTCGASVREGQPWCTQCWVDLREMPAGTTPAPTVDPATPTATPSATPSATPAATPAATPSVPESRAEGTTGGTPPGRGWPCTACGGLNDLALGTCAVCGTPFLAAGETRPTLVLPVVGDVLEMSRGQRLLLAGAVALVGALLVVLVVTLVGAVS